MALSGLILLPALMLGIRKVVAALGLVTIAEKTMILKPSAAVDAKDGEAGSGVLLIILRQPKR